MLANFCRIRSTILPKLFLSQSTNFDVRISSTFFRSLSTPSPSTAQAKTTTTPPPKESPPKKADSTKKTTHKKQKKAEIKHVTGTSTAGYPNLWKKRRPNPFKVKLNASKLSRIYSKIDHYKGMLRRPENKQKVKLTRPPNPTVDLHVARGDLVEVKFLGEAYLMQTFTGICIERRNKGIMSSILLANSEFGLHQRFYLYSPTIGQIKILERKEPYPPKKIRKKPWADRI